MEVVQIEGNLASIITLTNHGNLNHAIYMHNGQEWSFMGHQTEAFPSVSRVNELKEQGDSISLPTGKETDFFLEEYGVDIDGLTKSINGSGLGQTIEYRNKYDDVVFTYSPKDGFSYCGWGVAQ